MLAALVGSIVLLPLLGHKPLTDWDEGIYAEVSREMLQGHWGVPHWNQQLWFEKPPLMLWVTAALFRLFGISELSARLGSALSGLALVSILHLWLERRLNRVTAWSSTVILLSTFGFLHVCRVGEMDALLSLGCVLGLIGLTDVNRSCGVGWYVFWAGASIALMTKGAASAPLFLCGVIFAVLERWRAPRFSKEFWVGGALFLFAVAPWHIAMYEKFGRDFLLEYLGLHVWSRATQQIEGHSTHWWFYLKVLFVSAPPFVLLYPIATVRALRTGVLRAFGLFGATNVLFYSLVQTRLPHYIAPCYPAFTAVTAAWLALHVCEVCKRRPSAGVWIKIAFAAAAFCSIAMLATSRSRASLHSNVLSDGSLLPDNKDAIALLRHAPSSAREIPGPLLVWRKAPAPINAEIFYARRTVEQVQIPGDATAEVFLQQEKDRYINNPVPLLQAASSGPRLILLDRDLIFRLPPALTFSPIEQGREVVLGSVQLATGPAATRP